MMASSSQEGQKVIMMELHGMTKQRRSQKCENMVREDMCKTRGGSEGDVVEKRE